MLPAELQEKIKLLATKQKKTIIEFIKELLEKNDWRTEQMKITLEIHGLKLTKGFAYEGGKIPQAVINGLQEMANVLNDGIIERDGDKKINYFNRKPNPL